MYKFIIAAILSANAYAVSATSTINSETKTPDRVTKGRENWGLDLKLNTGLAKGNTDYFTFQNTIAYFKKIDPIFFHANGELQYGENAGQKNINYAMLTTRLDYHLYERWSLLFLNTIGHNEFTRVRFKDVTGVGPLYDIQMQTVRNGISIVIAYNYETYKTNAESKKDLVLALRNEFTAKLTDTLIFGLDYFYVPRASDFRDFNMRLTSTIENLVWKDFISMLVTFRIIHESQPQPGVKRNDIQLLAGIGFKFGK